MFLTKYFSGDQIKKAEVSRAYSKYGGEEGFGGENREEGHLEDPGANGRMILKQIFEKWDEGRSLD